MAEVTALDAARFLFKTEEDKDAARIVMRDGDPEERLAAAQFLFSEEEDKDAARIIMFSTC